MTRPILSVALVLAFTSWFASHAARAESRMALVMGNSAYRTVTPLPNPANDAKAMAGLLSLAGFEVVTAPDLTQSDMLKVISDFAASVAARGPDTVALIFYAGHGVQIDGENFLVPVDVNLQREEDVPLQTVRLNDLMNRLAAVPSKMRIILLDACRNDPFAEIAKTAGHGLAIVDAPAGSSGSLVSYSTSPGAEAEDGAGADSPYTTALLAAAREPGLPIEEAFKHVRLSVNHATDGRQTPWESSSLTTDFFFFPGQAGRPPAAGAGPARTVDDWRRQLQSKPAREAYEIVIRDDTIEAYQAFVGLYSQAPFGPRVRGLLDRRQEMVAWYVAVNTNTVEAYQTFLASYPNSDLATTARKLIDRAGSHLLMANAAAGAGGSGPSSTAPTRVANATPVAACSCSTPTSPPKRSIELVPQGPSGPPEIRTDLVIPPPLLPPPEPPARRHTDDTHTTDTHTTDTHTTDTHTTTPRHVDIPPPPPPPHSSIQSSQRQRLPTDEDIAHSGRPAHAQGGPDHSAEAIGTLLGVGAGLAIGLGGREREEGREMGHRW
jgi:Caspase domain